MKYSQTINCSTNEAWKAITDSLINDIKNVSGKEMSENDIERGFHYQKKMQAARGGFMETKILIKEFKKPTLYTAEFTNSESIIVLSYSLEEISDNECIITYEESYTGKRKLNSWNAKLVAFLFKIKNKNKVKKIFKQIEEYAIATRSN